MNEYFKKNRWFILGIGWVILSLLLIANYLLPKLETTIAMYHKLQNQKEQISSVQNWQNQLDDLRKQKDHLETYFSDVYVGLPDDNQMSTIVEEIFDKAQKADIRLSRIRPFNREEHDSHTLIPINIEAEGSYHRVSRFINEMEQSKYLIKVLECNLRSGEEEISQLQSEILVHVIILRGSRDLELKSDA